MIVFFYYLIALLCALILLNAYRKGNDQGRKIGKVMLATFLLVIFYSFNLLGVEYRVKSFFLSAAYITVDYLVIYFYEYIISFIGWEKRLPSLINKGLYAYAVIDSIFLLINPYNEIVVSYEVREFHDLQVLCSTPHYPFILHGAFDIGVVLFIILLLLLKCVETPRIYRKRYFMLIAGTFAAVFVNALHLMLSEILPIDIAPALYCVVGMLMYYNTYRYLPMVTVSLTKNLILNHLSEPVILFDYEGRLADMSRNAKKLFPEAGFDRAGYSLKDFLEDVSFGGMGDLNTDQQFEWTGKTEGKNHTYLVKYRRLADDKERLLGVIFLFSDITFAREAYFSLERSVLYDPVSGFYNKESFRNQIPQWNDERYWPVALAVCNVNGLRQINDEFGTAYGDAVMVQVARFMRMDIGMDTFAAKTGNGDYVVVFEQTTHSEAAEIMERVKERVARELDPDKDISIEYGIAVKERADITIDRVLSDARNSMQNKKMLREGSASSSLVDSLKQTLGESDFETEEHVERTRIMAARLGRRLKLSDSDVGRLELLAVLHDIGKVAVPHDVLVKKGKLNDEEFKIMQQHTVKGYRIAMASPELREIAEGILSHHEKWDGTGYPNRLKGEEIPLLARIISAVDSHDVMVNNRPYHQAMPEENAIKELRRCAGTQFDPNIIKVFTEMLEEDLKEMNKDTEEKENEKDQH